MKKLAILPTPLLILALILTAVGCGDDEDKATATPSATATPTPVGYTGGEHTFKVSHGSPTGTVVHVMFEKIDELLQQ